MNTQRYPIICSRHWRYDQNSSIVWHRAATIDEALSYIGIDTEDKSEDAQRYRHELEQRGSTVVVDKQYDGFVYRINDLDHVPDKDKL